MIKQYSLLALQKALNRALALDDTMPEKIKALHGKVLELIITPLQVHFFIRFHQSSIQLLAQHPDQVDTVIHCSPLGLIRLGLLPSSKVRSLFNDKVRLSGDLELGMEVKKLFESMDIDWEGHLAHFTGDVVAHQVGSMVRRGKRFTKRLKTSIRENTTEYLQDEVRLFPSREELSDFLNDVDALSLQVERLEAHVNHLLAESS